jgi:hypothetical protein
MSIIVDFRDARFRRDVKRLHRLGVRALYEMLVDLGARRLVRTEIERLVARFARIDPEALAAAGGDRMPPGAAEAVDFLDRAISVARRSGWEDREDRDENPGVAASA